MNEQAMSDRCRRCCEAGADHVFDAQRGDIVYLCYGCRYYETGAPESWTRRLLNGIAGMLRALRRVKPPGRD